MLWHALAMRLGSTIKNLQSTMSQKEFISWIAYNNLSPISDERADFHAAQITGMVFGANGGKDKSIEDFKLFKRPTPLDVKLDSMDPIEREFYESFKDRK